MTVLYHFTCDDGARGVRRDRCLRPNPNTQPGLPPVVWLTDLDVPDRAALGLTSNVLGCDRTRWRVTVDCDAEPWPVFARGLSFASRRGLEFAAGALPMHWWVTRGPVPVVRVDRVAGRATAFGAQP